MEKLTLKIENPKGNEFTINPPGNIPTGGIKDGTLNNILGTAVEVLILFAIILCLVIIAISGYQWLTSAGDKQKLNQVKQRLIYAIVGLIIVFMSYFAMNILSDFFKVNLLDI